MKKAYIVLAGLIILGLFAPMAETQKGKMSADAILERSIQAMGGRSAMNKIKSTTMKGTIQIQGMSGSFEIYQKAPNRYLMIQKLPSIGEIKQGFDGKIGWAQDPFSGIRNLEGPELEMTKREATHNAPLYWKKLYKKVELLGTRKAGNSTAYAVRMTPQKGKPVTQYFDVKSFLPVRADMTIESPQGTIVVETYFSDYRAVNGVKLPFTMKQHVGGMEVSLKITSVKNNAPMNDNIFKKPTK